MSLIRLSKSLYGLVQPIFQQPVLEHKLERQPMPFIILPLYIYPTADSWNILYSSLTQYPQLRFLIILNPSNGPGSSRFPDSNYITAITKLRQYPNVELLGYIHIEFGNRPENSVRNDIDKYAGWKQHSGSDIHIDGIFFDEAPGSYSDELFLYMKSVHLYAKRALGGIVVFNPGVIVDAAYYSIADFVVSFEEFHTAYSRSSLGRVEEQLKIKSCVLIHHFTGTIEEQRAIVRHLSQERFAGMFISTNEYDSWSSFWQEFCAAVATL